MKKIALFLLIALSACQYDDSSKDYCGVKNPVNDLPWLKEKIRKYENQTVIEPNYRITQAEYSGERGFTLNICCTACNTLVVFYKCSGDSVVVNDLSKFTTNGTVIWQPANFQCSN